MKIMDTMNCGIIVNPDVGVKAEVIKHNNAVDQDRIGRFFYEHPSASLAFRYAPYVIIWAGIGCIGLDEPSQTVASMATRILTAIAVAGLGGYTWAHVENCVKSFREKQIACIGSDKTLKLEETESSIQMALGKFSHEYPEVILAGRGVQLLTLLADVTGVLKCNYFAVWLPMEGGFRFINDCKEAFEQKHVKPKCEEL